MNWYLKVLKQYADFNGRARRKEYWMFTLLNTIFIFVTAFLGPLYFLYILLTFIPGLAVSVRRLHDTGNSGWMYLIVLIPLVGPIWLLVLMLKDSQQETNKWGENPKVQTDN